MLVTLYLVTTSWHLYQHNEILELQVWVAHLFDWTGPVSEKPVYGISRNKKNGCKAKAPPHQLSPDWIFVIAKRKSWPVHTLPDKDNLGWEEKVNNIVFSYNEVIMNMYFLAWTPRHEMSPRVICIFWVYARAFSSYLIPPRGGGGYSLIWAI